MPDETGTEKTRSDAPSADESPFGDAADDTPAAVADEQDSAGETEQGQESPEDAGEGNDSEDAEAQEVENEKGSNKAGADASEQGLKVVVSIKGARATIGVQQPSSDPHIESFDDLDESGLTQEVGAVIDRARARWEESPKHPAYERPAPPARRRNRGGQRSAQASDANAETEQAQQQTLKLF